MIQLRDICRKYNISYMLVGGSLLGAVRHKGFILRDDDIDVAMLREDYEKFRIVCQTDLDKVKYYLQDDRNCQGYRWGYAKLRKKGTLFLRENQEHLNFGQEIFIDIFPMDYVPEDSLKRYVYSFYGFLMRKTLWSIVGKNVEQNRLKRICYIFLSKISKERVYKSYYKLIDKTKNSKLVRNYLFPASKPYELPIYYLNP